MAHFPFCRGCQAALSVVIGAGRDWFIHKASIFTAVENAFRAGKGAVRGRPELPVKADET